MEWLAGLAIAAGFVALMLWSGPGGARRPPGVARFAARAQDKVHDLRLRALREKRCQRLVVVRGTLVHEEATSSGMGEPRGWREVGRLLHPEGVEVSGGPIVVYADSLAEPASLVITGPEAALAELSVSRVGLPTVEVAP